MTSNLTETDSDDSDDEIPDHKHCDICNLELKSVNHTLYSIWEVDAEDLSGSWKM